MITTKKGDKGQTNCGEKIVDKDNLVVEVVGSVDELQSVLELAGGEVEIVDDLSQIMGVIGCGSKVDILKKVWRLEKEMERMEEELPKLEKFLRFKSKKALELNWARTVTRRVERRIVSLNKMEKLDPEILIYFNRLSDYLFLKARKKDK